MLCAPSVRPRSSRAAPRSSLGPPSVIHTLVFARALLTKRFLHQCKRVSEIGSILEVAKGGTYQGCNDLCPCATFGDADPDGLADFPQHFLARKSFGEEGLIVAYGSVEVHPVELRGRCGRFGDGLERSRTLNGTSGVSLDLK
jgi:hypothetical protein